MYLKESFFSAIKSLTSNKMRALLTMLGIIIGISSVITITTLGKGGQKNVTESFGDIASKAVEIRLEVPEDEVLRSKDFFTNDDVKLLSSLEEIKWISLQSHYWGYTFIDDEENYLSMNTGNEQLLNILDLKLLYGRNFTKDEAINGKKVVVLDDHLAMKMFNTANVVGREVELFNYNGRSNLYLVVGVVENPFKKFIATTRQDIFSPLMPKETAKKYMLYTRQDKIIFTPEDMSKKDESANILIKSLEEIKGRKDLYKLDNSSAKEVESFNKVLGIISVFISFVAAISLVVGGIGVMNIMLVTVTERTKEIGIRKSLGARNKDILIQFLIEAIILTIIGGVLGVSIGYGTSLLIGIFAKIKPILSLNMVILSLSVSSITGLIFGVFPAIKASKLNPIDALRYE